MSFEKSGSGPDKQQVSGVSFREKLKRDMRPSPEDEEIIGNREERRRWKKAVRRAVGKTIPKAFGLMSQERILTQEDDMPLLIREMKLYQQAQLHTDTEILAYGSFIRLGVADSDCKEFFVGLENNPNLFSKMKNQMNMGNIQGRKELTTAFNSLVRYGTYRDPDESEIIKSLAGDNNIKGIDILKEIRRARKVSIDLMRMQIDWLREKQALQRKQEKVRERIGKTVEIKQELEIEEKLASAVLQDFPEELPETKTELEQEVEEPFLLKGWDLFITESSPWSSAPTAPNHLTSIPTGSKQEALNAIAKFTRKIASIKPISILNSMEFHARKDVYQKALSARLRYVPDDVRKWVKITRGKDRMYFLIPNPEEARAILYVKGRDDIYKSLRNSF